VIYYPSLPQLQAQEAEARARAREQAADDDPSAFDEIVEVVATVGDCISRGAERAEQGAVTGFVIGSVPNPFIEVTPEAGALGGAVAGGIEGCAESFATPVGP